MLKLGFELFKLLFHSKPYMSVGWNNNVEQDDIVAGGLWPNELCRLTESVEHAKSDPFAEVRALSNEDLQYTLARFYGLYVE